MFKDNLEKVDIGLNVTRRCNLDCSFCFFNNRLLLKKNVKRIIPEIDLSLEPAINKLFQYNIRSVFICGGEPFMYPELKQLLEWLTVRSDSIYISTNGTLITEKWIKYLSQDKIILLVSVKDSSKSSFEKLKKLKDAGIRIQLYHVLTKNSEEILKSISERYNWVEHVRLLFETHTDPNKNNILSIEEWFELIRKARRILNNIIDIVDVEMGYVNKTNKIAKLVDRGAVNRIIIDTDLRTYPCPLLVERKNGTIDSLLPNNCNIEECPVIINETIDENYVQVCPFLVTNLKLAADYIDYIENLKV